ncbi:hypothetical protein MMC07_008589 [Pseudocyphellaria aurata]|nr:hypothetical protein [Pseudocyphellaria aurata]
MTAEASSQLGTSQQAANHENVADYVKPQLRQPLPHPSKNATDNTTAHQSELAQENGRRKRPSDRLADPRLVALSRSDSAQRDQPVQTPADSSLDQDPHGARPKGQLQRANTDVGPRRESPAPRPNTTQENWELRHGWDDQYNSSEYLNTLSSTFYMYYTTTRHSTGGKPKDEGTHHPPQEWRMRDRLKTVSAAIAVCLNIGVDPPDVVKTNPAAKLECWIDPTLSTAASSKTMEHIGKKLQEQYETLSIRVRYKVFLDPSVDETRKFCTSLRRNAKDERILFHYNGHGVPLPTQSGEIWVFNKTYTQYIPVSLYDLQAWLGAPSLYVFDCSHAGNILLNFDRFVEKHETENAELRLQDPNAQPQSYSDNIQLAACGKSESLPTSPDLPADLFTCCLTTPIEISLRFFVLENRLPSDLTLNDIGRIPGRLQERRSPLGELNWIFTAITDTIAWNTLPRALFKKLFRQDLMVAALFRNFLLSERIMRANGCRPMSMPQLPETHNHTLWQAWDLAVEMVLAQLPAMLASEEYEYQHSNFFTEQLTAFEVYLAQGAPSHEAPSQLPIVLQVLLSQVHRLRALILLSKFFDLGPWAVNLALTIGIFPYVLKLLQSAAWELKPVMIFIWTRILAVDGACQADLLKDNGYQYFLTLMSPQTNLPVATTLMLEHRAMCAFIVAMFCKDFRQGQVVCLSPDLINMCIAHLRDTENPLLRQWSCLCLSVLWADFPDAKWVGIRCLAHQKLCELALDPVPEVRAAAVHALTTFLGIPDLTLQVAQCEESIASTILIMTTDGNSMVREELLVFFSTFVKRYINRFLVAAFEQLVDERDLLLHPNADTDTGRPYVPQAARSSSGTSSNPAVSRNSVQGSMWMHLLIMTIDAHPGVAQGAGIIVDYVHESLLESPLGPRAQPLVDDIVRLSRRPVAMSRQPSAAPTPRQNQVSPSPTPQSSQRNEGYLSIGMRRTASVAAALKHLALGTATSSDDLPASLHRAATNASAQQQPLPGPIRARVPAEWTRPPDDHDHVSNSTVYQQAKVPTPRGFKNRDPLQAPSIPLKSGFFDWSIEYFLEPQMKPMEPDEPGSDDYNSRLWRRIRNEKTLNMTQPLKGIAGINRWDISAGFFNNGTQPMKMCFHQYEEHLAVADDRDTICIWNWKQSARTNRFSNGNPSGSKINEAQFINEDDQALLMTGSSDGMIKIFRNYESEKHVEMVAAFRALTDLVPSNKNAGLVFDWQQGQGKLLVAGDVKVIRVWNADTEICTSDIPARSGSCITSLTSDQVAGNVFVGGYGDGAIRVFDQRLKPALAMVKVWREHKQWITNIHMQRGGLRELVSGSRNGEIKFWDIRMDAPLNTMTATKQTLRTLSMHEHAPVFATGTERHNVNVFNVNGTLINSIEPYSSFLHPNRSSAIAATAFHPHRMMLACSSLSNSHVNLFTCQQ